MKGFIRVSGTFSSFGLPKRESTGDVQNAARGGKTSERRRLVQGGDQKEHQKERQKEVRVKVEQPGDSNDLGSTV